MDIVRSFSIQQSIGEAIRKLYTPPVTVGPIHQVPIDQVTNRAPDAHLSIEVGIKALVKDSGGTYDRSHNLWPNFQKLEDCDAFAAEFLESAFNDVVRFYGFNPNAKGFTHLKSIAAYLSTAGSERGFNAMRYWELERPLDAEIISKVFLLIHGELLTALCQLFISRANLCTVGDRVEARVAEALPDELGAELAYSPGSVKEYEVYSYLEWLKGFPNWCAALAEAKRRKFDIGNATANSFLAKAYQSLAQGNDPAVQYYLRTLDILPPQQRDYLPEVEWIEPTELQRGAVKSPAGTTLGNIEKRTDGLWGIFPLLTGLPRRLPIAATQTDARAWLANFLTHPVTVSVGGNRREQRLLGGANGLRRKPLPRLSGDDIPIKPYTWELEFWDENHGLELGNEVAIKFRPNPSESFISVLEGTVLAVDRWKASVDGSICLRVITGSGPEKTALAD